MEAATDQFLTVPKAALQVGKPKMTLYRWISQNKLSVVRFGGILFVPVSEVERLKRELPQPTGEP